jgi:VanZ family protein
VKPKIVGFIPALLWLIITIILLTLPGSDIPQAPFFEIIYFDKWVHIGMFGILMLLWSYPFLKDQIRAKNAFAIVGVSIICYGVLMEFVQKYFTYERSFDISDIMADAAGVIIVWFWLIQKLRKTKDSKSTEINKPL